MNILYKMGISNFLWSKMVIVVIIFLSVRLLVFFMNICVGKLLYYRNLR